MTIKINISGTSYDVQESIDGATLLDLFELKKKSKELGEPVTVASIAGSFEKIDAAESEAEALSDESVLINLYGLVFLARRKAGEDVRFEDVDVAVNEVKFEFVAEEEAADPKEVSGAADVEPGADS